MSSRISSCDNIGTLLRYNDTHGISLRALEQSSPQTEVIVDPVGFDDIPQECTNHVTRHPVSIIQYTERTGQSLGAKTENKPRIPDEKTFAFAIGRGLRKTITRSATAFVLLNAVAVYGVVGDDEPAECEITFYDGQNLWDIASNDGVPRNYKDTLLDFRRHNSATDPNKIIAGKTYQFGETVCRIAKGTSEYIVTDIGMSATK